MTARRTASPVLLLPVAGLLAIALRAAGQDDGDPRIDAPEPYLEPTTGVLVAPRGFVARLGERVLLGDALRYDRTHDDLYAKGRVVFVLPGVRIHADRLGLHPKAQTGEAWGIEALVEHAGRRVVIHADHVQISRRELVFEGARLDGGNGGIVSLTTTTARVLLRDKPASDRDGIARQVEGVEVVSPAVRLLGVPVLWVPWLYRDFTYDYPWTTAEVGHSRRLGSYGRGWVGSNLHALWGWTPRLVLRGDTYSRTGDAYGATGSWRNAELGYGQVGWYHTPREIVMGGADDKQNLVERDSHVLDVEQQLHGLGGALYARWTSTPDPDPVAPGDPPAPEQRYRADYLRDDLEHRPFSRRGVTAAWGFSAGTLVLDTERRDNVNLRGYDRLWGTQAVLPAFDLVGPFHVSADGWAEDLRRESTDDHALRTTWQAGLGFLQWLGPLGVDAAAGARGLGYRYGTLAGIDQPDSSRLVPFAESGLRLRAVGEWDNGVTHVVTARVGIEVLQPGRGDALPTYSWGDPRDQLDEDLRLLVTGLETSLSGERHLFRARADARWALREEDRMYTDSLGAPQRAENRLYDLRGTVSGSPMPTLNFTGTVVYLAQTRSWTRYDLGASWVVARHAQVRYTGALVPADATHGDLWQHQPGISLLAERYRLDVDVMFRPDGKPIDGWSMQLTRQMVDGGLVLFYEAVRNEAGGLYDQRVGIGFNLTTGTPDPAAPPQRGAAAGLNVN